VFWQHELDWLEDWLEVPVSEFVGAEGPGEAAHRGGVGPTVAKEIDDGQEKKTRGQTMDLSNPAEDRAVAVPV
jgi:hypothetical protein